MNTLAAVGLKHFKDILLDNKLGDVTMESNDEIASRLKFIGHIQKDEKINVRYMSKHPNNWATTFSRSLIYHDNRNNALKFVRDVISRSFEIIEQYLCRQNIYAAHSVAADLIKAQQGLVNLKHTYSEDTKFCCDMEVLVGIVASKLTELRNRHVELFKEKKEEEKEEEDKKEDKKQDKK